MASTLRYSDIMNLVQRHVLRNVEDSMAANIVSAGMNMIWQAYDWRESLADITPFYLIPGRQDYPSDIITIPEDIHGLKQVFLVRLNGEEVYKQPLSVLRQVERTNFQTLPNTISYMTTLTNDKSGYRVHPRPATNYGAPYYLIEGTYKKRSPSIDAAGLNDVIPFDDQYQGVLYSVFVYWGKYLMGSQDVEQAANLAVMNINTMANNEGLNDGELHFAPRLPLVGGYGNTFGLNNLYGY